MMRLSACCGLVFFVWRARRIIGELTLYKARGRDTNDAEVVQDAKEKLQMSAIPRDATIY